MHIIVVNIAMKFYENPAMREGDMLWTNFLYLIIFSDLDHVYINLNYMFLTISYDNYHLCFNPSINDDSMALAYILNQ
jgi:hypothetical protein